MEAGHSASERLVEGEEMNPVISTASLIMIAIGLSFMVIAKALEVFFG